jgi:hypothetical protein
MKSAKISASEETVLAIKEMEKSIRKKPNAQEKESKRTAKLNKAKKVKVQTPDRSLSPVESAHTHLLPLSA